MSFEPVISPPDQSSKGINLSLAKEKFGKINNEKISIICFIFCYKAVIDYGILDKFSLFCKGKCKQNLAGFE